MAKKNPIEVIQALQGKEFPAVTPFGKWLKGRVVDGKENELILEFDIREDMANPIGMLHGGIISAIIGEMAGFTVYTMLTTGICSKFVMLNSNVDYLSPAKVGDKVIAKTRILRDGKIAVNVDCGLYRNGETHMANGTVNIIKLDNI